MTKRCAALALGLGACLGEESPPPREPRPAPIVARQEGVGPLTAATPALLRPLRAAFLGYDVTPVNNAGLEYHVSRSGQDLLFVVPDEEGKVFNVHVTSRRVAIADHTWVVGAPIDDVAAFTSCECWGGGVVCYTRGDHLAAALARACHRGDFATPDERRALLGTPVAKIIWSPSPFLTGPID